MHSGKSYKLSEFLLWTRRTIYFLLIISILPVLLYQLAGLKWIALPWTVVALLGTATAFIVGFKNTQTYNRLWEARQIYGSIVNTSRSFGMMARDFVTDKPAQQQLIYRHIAWLTALRFQLRETRKWETTEKRYNREYQRFYTIPERHSKLEDEVKQFIHENELKFILEKKNRATQLIAQQSKQLKELKAAGAVEPLNYVELENQLVLLMEHQGRCERIKNFPYPRQFASINKFFIVLFIMVVPFGLLNEFQKNGRTLCLAEHSFQHDCKLGVLLTGKSRRSNRKSF